MAMVPVFVPACYNNCNLARFAFTASYVTARLPLQHVRTNAVAIGR